MATVAKANVPGKLEQQLRNAAAGVTNVLPGVGMATVALEGNTYKVADLAKVFNGFADDLQGIRDQRSVLSDKVKVGGASKVSGRKLLASLKGLVNSTFGANSTQLGQFGFTPAKTRAPLDAGKQAVRVAKMLATRKARGTKGSVQKAEIKGTLTSNVVLSPDGEVIDTSPSQGGPATSKGT